MGIGLVHGDEHTTYSARGPHPHPLACEIVAVSVDAIIPEYWTEWTYRVPESLRGQVAHGQLVWVPLRDRVVLGIVAALTTDTPPPGARLIHAVVEPTFCLTGRQLNLAAWISERYCCSLFHAASLMLPPGIERRVVETFRLTDDGRCADLDRLTPTQRRIVEYLSTLDDGASLVQLRAALGGALTTVVVALRKQGLVAIDARIKQDHVPQSRPIPYVRAIADLEFEAPLTAPRQQEALEYLRRRLRFSGEASGALPVGAVTVAMFRKETGIGVAILNRLKDRGLVELGAVTSPDGVEFTRAPVPILTAAQQAVWDQLSASIASVTGETFLLHGVTGSGKTEIYLRAIAASLRLGKGAIVCVPEIALATQMVHRIQARFPGQVALLHSGQRDARRYANWERLRRGEAAIAIGPRSALFAPLEEIGCVILDEEHDAAYKQDARPRYHARAVASELARLHGAVCVLGSATPDVTTYAAASAGEIGYLQLPERVRPVARIGATSATLELPPVTLIDMREERKSGNAGVFSGALIALLQQAFTAREQSILLLNRRGTATFSQCRACGHVLMCPQCEVPLVYHADRERLRCHRCDFEMRPSTRCAQCGKSDVRAYGVGTQRVEDEVRRLLPEARVVRWDQDSLRDEGGHESILQRLEAREIDVLVGTQMVAKGLDLPMVTVIGVVNGDTQLHLPDYRAAERTFQLLTQVAGRAGRRSPGRVIIQTQSVDHPALLTAQRHDYAGFAAWELENRKRLGYPPYRSMARFVTKHRDEAKARAEADRLAFALARVAYRAGREDFEIIGPAPCFTAKIRGEYLWQVVAAGDDLTPVLRTFPMPYGWSLDVDPVSML